MGKNDVNITITAKDEASRTFTQMGVNANRALNQVKSDVESSTRSIDVLKTAAIAAVAGFGTKGAWDWLIDTNNKMEQAQIGFETMLGSAEKAKGFLDSLQDFAEKTPFEFKDLRTASSRMLAFGFTAEQIIPTLTAVGDATSALGLGSEGVNRVILALGQMKAKAKVSGEEMLQLTEAGIPAWEILAKAMGKSTAEVMKLSEKGAIPADKAIQALVQGMEAKFPGMMEKQSKTLGGMLSNMQDFKERAGRVLGEGIFEQVKPQVEATLDYFNRLKTDGSLEQWGRSIGDNFAYATAHAKQFLLVAGGFASIKMGQFMGAQWATASLALTGNMEKAAGVWKIVNNLASAYHLKMLDLEATAARSTAEAAISRVKMATVEAIGPVTKLKTAFSVLGSTMLSNPFTIALLGITALAGGIMYLRQRAQEAQEANTQLSTTEVDLINQYTRAKAVMDSNTASQQQKTEAQRVLSAVTNQYNEVSGRVCASVGAETAQINELTGALDDNTNAILTNLQAWALRSGAEAEQARINYESAKASTNMKLAADPLRQMDESGSIWAKIGHTPESDIGIMMAYQDEQPVWDAEKKYDDLRAKAESDQALYQSYLNKTEGLKRDWIQRHTGGSFGDLTGGGGGGAKETKEELLSVGSAFSTMANMVSEGSRTSLIEARDALQKMGVEAQKLSGGEGLVGSIETALTMLTDVVADKTGETGKALINSLHDAFESAGSMVRERGFEIDNQFELAMERINESLKRQAEEAARIAEESSKRLKNSLKSAQSIVDDARKDELKATQDYNDKVKDINEQTQKNLERVREDYAKTLDDTTNRLMNWAGLFETQSKKLAKTSVEKLTSNLKLEVTRFDQFYQLLGSLSAKGVDQGLIAELKEMGPKALPEVIALNNSTQTQLNTFVDLWKEKTKQAREQATAQTQKQRLEMYSKQDDILSDARKQLEKLRKEWQDNLSKIRTDTNDKMSSLAEKMGEYGGEAMESFIAAMKAKYPQLTGLLDQISAQISGASAATPTAIPGAVNAALYLDLLLKEKNGTLTASEKNLLAQIRQHVAQNNPTGAWNESMLLGGASGTSTGSTGTGSTSTGSSGSGSTSSSGKWKQYKQLVNDIVYDKGVAEGKIAEDLISKAEAIAEAQGFYAQLPTELANILKGMNYQQASSFLGGADFYHQGGRVTRGGRVPLSPGDVPIIAQEGETIIPAGSSGTNLSGLTRAVEKLVALLYKKSTMQFGALQKIENQTINNASDAKDISQELVRTALLAAGGVRF